MLLSHLREGKLELVYYSAFDAVEKLFNHSYEDHLQFYDSSVSLEELKELQLGFKLGFDMRLSRLADANELFPPLVKEQEEMQPNTPFMAAYPAETLLKYA